MLLIGVVSPESNVNGMITHEGIQHRLLHGGRKRRDQQPDADRRQQEQRQPDIEREERPGKRDVKPELGDQQDRRRPAPVPTRIDGSALPAMISAGRNGVTSS